MSPLLDTTYPRVAELIHTKRVLISVNQEIAHENTVIDEGDEVALLPPFAGGSHAGNRCIHASDEGMFVRVQRENFSLDAEIDRVRARSKRIGGVATFLGTARDWSKGRVRERYYLRTLRGMAQKKLREIRERALKQFDVLEVLIFIDMERSHR